MRHFAGGEVAPALLRKLLEAAHHAPSVGFMQPWRFIRIRDTVLRQRLHDAIERERVLTARALGEREDAFMHHRAHEECFIANSVKTEVRCEPVFAPAG